MLEMSKRESKQYNKLSIKDKLKVRAREDDGMTFSKALHNIVWRADRKRSKAKAKEIKKQRQIERARLCDNEAKTSAHFSMANAARERANGGTHTQYESNTKIQQVKPLKYRSKAINHQANIDSLKKAGIYQR